MAKNVRLRIESPVCKRNRKTTFVEVPKGEEWRAKIIRDLINIRDGLCKDNEWTKEEAIEGLLHVCTT